MNRTVAKQRVKQLVRRTIGEPYVGKRVKLRRLSRVLQRLELRPSAILDFGCEDATFTYWLADRYPGARVSAVDIDESAVSACIAARPNRYANRVNFEAKAFSNLAPSSFDLITVFDVLEHIDEDRAAIRHLALSMRPAGTLLVHVPRDRWITWSGVVHRVRDEEAWRINPGHVRQGYSPESITKLLSEEGLVVKDVQTWFGRWGVLAFAVYSRLEHPIPLRLISVPVTDLCAFLDRRTPTPEGNSVFIRAVKPE
jgi:2-polyprenyl-3-methyl-5-hydroxy-6-metoxy-1,4-benzoquinol methylase